MRTAHAKTKSRVWRHRGYLMEQANTNKGKNLLSAQDTALFCSQVALVLKSGIPLHDGISAIYENLDNHKAKEIFNEINEKVERNGTLHKALEESGIFPDYMVNMVDIGERTGKLDDVMESLSLYYEREDSLKKRIKSAVLYPFILIMMMGIVIGVLVVQVLPIFNQVFENLGSQMSAVSTLVMDIGLTAAMVALVIIGILVLIIIGMFIYSKTKAGTNFFSRFFSKFPLTRKLAEKIASGRFASVISMMVSSGYNTEEAIELAPRIINNDRVNEKIGKCKKLIDGGSSFADALFKVQIFSGIYSRMVGIGFKTGAVDTVMKKLADIYDEEIDDSFNNVISIIEPTMVAVMCIVIGIILMSVMLPLMGVMSTIG